MTQRLILQQQRSQTYILERHIIGELQQKLQLTPLYGLQRGILLQSIILIMRHLQMPQLICRLA